MVRRVLSSEEMKTILVPPQSRLNEDIAKNLDDIFSLASPREYRDALIEIYSSYIRDNHTTLPPHFGDIADRMIALLNFFKVCDEA